METSMTCPEILNLIGLCLSIVAAPILFFSSPSHSMDIDGGSFTGAPTETELKNKKKENIMKLGFIILLLGITLQIISVILK